jgi:hypothetical protein
MSLATQAIFVLLAAAEKPVGHPAGAVKGAGKAAAKKRRGAGKGKQQSGAVKGAGKKGKAPAVAVEQDHEVMHIPSEHGTAWPIPVTHPPGRVPVTHPFLPGGKTTNLLCRMSFAAQADSLHEAKLGHYTTGVIYLHGFPDQR